MGLLFQYELSLTCLLFISVYLCKYICTYLHMYVYIYYPQISQHLIIDFKHFEIQFLPLGRNR